jgi:hypothetical protein
MISITSRNTKTNGDVCDLSDVVQFGIVFVEHKLNKD